MNKSIILKSFNIICLIIFIMLVLMVFWVTIIRDMFFIPVHAGFYKCERPYIGIELINKKPFTTLTNKTYCVELYIDYKNISGLNTNPPNANERLILNYSNLYTVSTAKKHSFFSKSSQPYEYTIDDVGYFFLSYQQNWVKKDPKVETVQPQLIIKDINLKSILF